MKSSNTSAVATKSYPAVTKKQAALKSPRLYSRAVLISYKRSRLNVHPNAVLVRIEGVQSRKDTAYYLGKRVEYIYRCSGPKSGKKVKRVFGKVIAAHGNSGVVRAKFSTNLCGDALGKECRVYMY